ncbi:MAG: hypothetical protein JST05_09475 [Acidobacteria bacterium]|nr:hypothetical protein [Acidobacteriota bacterium]
MTDTILEDWAKRKDAEGVAWFDARDLARLGIPERLMTAMQNVQHTLRLRRSDKVVETQGQLDRFSVCGTE